MSDLLCQPEPEPRACGCGADSVCIDPLNGTALAILYKHGTGMARHGLDTYCPEDCQVHAPSLAMMLLGPETSGFSLSSLPWQNEGSLFTARFGGFWLLAFGL